MTEILGEALALPVMLAGCAMMVKPLRYLRDAALRWDDNREKGV